MTSKDRMIRALAGDWLAPPPVVLHSWGDYKIALAGIHPKFQGCLGGSELAEIESAFYERFMPDWLHLGSGGRRDYWDRPRRVRRESAYIQTSTGRWIEIRDDYSIPDPEAHSHTPLLRLESVSEIDDFYAANAYTEEEVLHSGRFEHVSILAARYGNEALIAINDGAPGCGLPNHSFEETMIACVTKPHLVAYYIQKDCERFLTDVRAARLAGAHAYIFSEGFGGSLDLLSPTLHERLELDAKRWFYQQVRQIGIIPIGYWLGDVRPNMHLINSLDMAGLMIEESKKGFILDPVQLRGMLRPDICLFGNVDSVLLRQGTPGDVRAEVRRQKEAAQNGPFVTANGSPLIIGTPPANIEAFLEEARC